MRALWVSPALVLALALPLAADEVILKNGAVFSGIVREEGEKVRIEMDFGTVTFKRVDVRSITRSDDPLREFDERKLKTAGDAKSTYALAQWAREKGLTTRSNDLLKKVLELDPEHVDARKALGYEKFEGKWLEGDELMVAKGFVKHQGKWLLRETAERLKEQETQILIESDRIRAEEKAARMRREIELAKLAVERERIEMEREKCQGFGWWGPTPWRCRCPRGHAFVLPPPAPSQRVPLTAPSVLPPTAPSVLPPTPPSVVPPSKP